MFLFTVNLAEQFVVLCCLLYCFFFVFVRNNIFLVFDLEGFSFSSQHFHDFSERNAKGVPVSCF